jgi:hypothetical protein
LALRIICEPIVNVGKLIRETERTQTEKETEWAAWAWEAAWVIIA